MAIIVTKATVIISITKFTKETAALSLMKMAMLLTLKILSTKPNIFIAINLNQNEKRNTIIYR